MLIEVDGVEPSEDSWQGKRVRFGEATVRMGDPCHAATTLDRLRHAERAGPEGARGIPQGRHRPAAGVYGDVEQPSVIRIGDPVELLD
jgi:hypothetical protein